MTNPAFQPWPTSETWPRGADSAPPPDFMRRLVTAALAMVCDDEGRAEREAIQCKATLTSAELEEHMRRIGLSPPEKTPDNSENIESLGCMEYPKNPAIRARRWRTTSTSKKGPKMLRKTLLSLAVSALTLLPASLAEAQWPGTWTPSGPVYGGMTSTRIGDQTFTTGWNSLGQTYTGSSYGIGSQTFSYGQWTGGAPGTGSWNYGQSYRFGTQRFGSAQPW